MYVEELKKLQKRHERASKRFSEGYDQLVPEAIADVISNVMFSGYRRDKAKEMVESYFDLWGAQVSGWWLLNKMEKLGYVYDSREEVGWGEHDWFTCLTSRGTELRDTLMKD